MRNNITALQHPTIQRKIRHAIWLAKLEAHRNYLNCNRFTQCGWHGRQYVQNRNGHNIMRIDWRIPDGCCGAGYLVAYGDQSRNITHIVKQALGI